MPHLDLLTYLETYEPQKDAHFRVNNAGRLTNTVRQLEEKSQVLAELLEKADSPTIKAMIPEWKVLLANAVVHHLLVDRFQVIAGNHVPTEHYLGTLVAHSPKRKETPSAETLKEFEFSQRLDRILDKSITSKKGRELVDAFLRKIMKEAARRVSTFTGKGKFSRHKVEFTEKDFKPGHAFPKHGIKEVREHLRLCGIQ